MPQSPLATQNVPGGQKRLNITAATVVKAAPGRVIKAFVVVAGSTVGSLNNCTTTGAAAAANEVCALPDVVGPVDVNVPFDTGIVVTPGTGQTISIFFQ